MVKYQKEKFILIAGPCVIESKQGALQIAQKLKDITARYDLQFIFKASFDKANRTSVNSYRGPGLAKGIKILAEIKKKTGVPVLSDVHEAHQVKDVKGVLDVIQIPAFLSRQTDLIVAAARTKKIVNIKKSQMMSPEDMRYPIEKALSAGNKKVFVTERGTAFGYQNLIVDFRSLLIMKKFGYPVILDATHALQRPSSAGGSTGGDRDFVAPLSLAGVACGIGGLFLEVHPRPSRALSDRTTSFALGNVDALLKNIMKVREVLYEKK